MRLEGKVAIVTGGARDIGRAVSLKLAKEGAKICVNYFDNPDNAKETIESIQALGSQGIMVQGDMTKADDVAKVVKETQAAFGNDIHILVNVAGGLVGRKTITEMEESFWDFLITLNLKSVFLVTKAVVPFMPSGGAIINFSSVAARDGGGPGASAYAAAKGGVMTYTRSLAKELGPKNIRVNAVSPGMIATTFHDVFTKPEVRVNVANSTPLKREGTADEVADLVMYLASDESSFLNGTNIDINGGLAFS